MRKPRDYDAEMKALADKARQLKIRKQSQLGELVIACGTDVLAIEELAGALLAAATTTDPAAKEEWRKRGAAFFLRSAVQAGNGTGHKPGGTATGDVRTQSPAAEQGAT